MRTLEGLLAVLDEDDVTEIVLTPGQPITVRRAGGYTPLDDELLEMAGIDALIEGTPIGDEIADGGGNPPLAVTVGASTCTAEVQVFGAQVIVRLIRDPSVPRAPRPAPPPVTTTVSFTRSPPSESIAPPIAEEQEQELELLPEPDRTAPSTAPPVGREDGGEASLPRLEPLRTVAASARFIALVEAARNLHATDMHVSAGLAPVARTVEGLVAIGAPLDERTVDGLLRPLLTVSQHLTLDRRGYVDTAIDLGPVARLRANISRTRLGLKGTFRLVLASPPTLEQLGLPADLAKVTSYHQGFVVIAGPNGHGKTATLAALIDLINSTRAQHILTVEDPVEIIHPRKKSVISQREVGSHTRGFATALKASLREDPDVIVIGELRDRETVEIALTAAETGHLVIATMSTPSAAKTIDRLIDMFPPDDRPQVRASLAAALRFVLAQRLLPAADGQGLVAAVELITGVLPLAALIRDDKLYQLPSLMQRGRAFGMIRIDNSLADLFRAGKITEEVALRAAENRAELWRTINPAAAAAAAAAAAEPPPPPGAAARGLADIKSRLGGIFGKKERE